MTTTTPYGGYKRPDAPGGAGGSPTLSNRVGGGRGGARGRGPLPSTPSGAAPMHTSSHSTASSNNKTWSSAPSAWSRRGAGGGTGGGDAAGSSPSSGQASTAAVTYPAYTYPSAAAALGSTPSKIGALTAKFESSTSTRPTSPSSTRSPPAWGAANPSSTRSPPPAAPAPSPSPSTPAPVSVTTAAPSAGYGPTSVRTQLMNSGSTINRGGAGHSLSAPVAATREMHAAPKPSWKNLPPPPAAPVEDEDQVTIVVTAAVKGEPSELNGGATAEADGVGYTESGSEEEQQQVTCSLCDHVFALHPDNSACPMCGEVYGAEADGAEQGGAAEYDAPRQVECSLCDHPYEYPTLQECPMCGEAYGAVDEPPPPAAANASGEPAPGSITAMLMQLQQSVAQQQQQQAADEQANNLQLQQLRLEEEEAKRPKSIEEEAKRMVMCGHCNHTYEYPTYNFCDNCGHPSSNASLRLSQIKRQTWSQGRQSMQIGAGAIEQMLAAAASGNGLQDPQQQQLDFINFCPDCGTSTDGGSQRFCGMCGKSFMGDEPALPGDCDAPTSPTSSSRYETGERDKLKRKNKSWGKKTSYRTYFREVSSSPITARVKKFSKRGRDDKSSRTIEVKTDWQHMVAASLPSTPDAISAYKQMMIAKYEAQQKENVFIRSNSRRGSAEYRSLDTAALGASYRQDAGEDMSPLSPRSQGHMYHPPLSPRGGDRIVHQPPLSPHTGYAHTSYRAASPGGSSPNLISSPSTSYRIPVGHQELDQNISAVLAELNLAKYGTAFAQEEITYEAFLMLEPDDLTQMGIPIGPRKLMLAKILDLKQQQQ